MPKGYRYEEYVGDTAEFLKRVVGEPAYIAGHSLGALVAIQLGAGPRNSSARWCWKIRPCTITGENA